MSERYFMVKSYGWWSVGGLYCHLLGLGVGVLSISISHFQFPMGWRRRGGEGGGPGGERGLLCVQASQLRGSDSSSRPTGRDRRSSISTRRTSSGNKTTVTCLTPEIGCTLCRKELKGAIKSKVWIHIGVTHYKTNVILQMKGIVSG